jgi:hypothetical protein
MRLSASTISPRRWTIAASGVGIFIDAGPADPATPLSALARVIPRIGLVDDEYAPLPAHNAAVLVALFQ